jgi:hypothetical protein
MTDYENSFAHDDVATRKGDRSGDTWQHPVNVGHLVMGIAFLGMVLVWALITSNAVAGDDIRWLMPIPWVAAGGAGLLAIVRSARRRS